VTLEHVVPTGAPPVEDELSRLRAEVEEFRRLKAVDGLLDALSSVLDIREVFDRVSEIARPILPHDALILGRVTPDRQAIRIWAHSAIPEGISVPEVASRRDVEARQSAVALAENQRTDVEARVEAGTLSEADLDGTPFAALDAVSGAAPLEDAYLFGLRLRVLAREGRVDEAMALVTPWGAAVVAEPSLEDVFVDLARGYAARKPAAPPPKGR